MQQTMNQMMRLIANLPFFHDPGQKMDNTELQKSHQPFCNELWPFGSIEFWKVCSNYIPNCRYMIKNKMN